MQRTITIFGLIQVLLVISGFFGLGIIMKFDGYPDQAFGILWTPLALWLRLHGLYLLLAPVVWCIGTALSERQRGFILPTNLWLGLGIILMAGTVVAFLYACAWPYTRPLLFFQNAPH